jgi:hypothetical protein
VVEPVPLTALPAPYTLPKKAKMGAENKRICIVAFLIGYCERRILRRDYEDKVLDVGVRSLYTYPAGHGYHLESF